MTVITWVLAADASRARIFETRGLKLDLQQVEDLRNPAARTVESKEQNDAAREAFARSVADHLERCRTQHRFERLRLAVDPRFLALLRAHLSIETLKLVYEESGNESANRETRGLHRHL
jgi:protein required for attachment to host cells